MRTSIRAVAVACAAVAAVLAVAACDGTAEESSGLPAPTGCPASTTVWLMSTGFVPPCATVSPGATVTFQNADSVNHTVTTYSQPESFDSRVLAPGQQFSHTFAPAAERVEIRCSLHPSTVGVVLVQ